MHTGFIFYLHELLSKFQIFLDAHIIIYKHSYAYMVIGVVFDGFSIKVMLWVLWQLITEDLVIYDSTCWLAPPSQWPRFWSLIFLFIPFDTCPQLALILVDDGVRVGGLCYLSLLNVARCLTFSMCPFDFWEQKWEPIWLFWQSLEAYCVKIWSHLPPDKIEKK